MHCFQRYRKILILFFLLVTETTCFPTLSQTISEKVKKVDEQTFSIINQIDIKPLNYIMCFFTLLADCLFLIPIVGFVLFFFDPKKFKSNFFTFLFILLLGGLLIHILKIIIQRPRPLKMFSDVKILLEPLKENSFPSGHAQAIFTTAIFLFKKIKKFLLLFITIALLSAISRIYVGVHYLSDIVVGAFIGCFVTLVVFFFIERKKQQIES